MARFEAVFEPGEDNERMPEWQVVDWYFQDEQGNRIGKIVAYFDGDLQDAYQSATIEAEFLNAQHAQELENFG